MTTSKRAIKTEKLKPEAEVEHKERPQRGPAMECSSRTIRIDHLADLTDSQVIPQFLDTKSMPEAVIALVNYHGQAHRLVDMGLISNLAASEKTAAAALYTVNEALSYLVVDNAVYEELKGNPEGGAGSDLETCAVLLDMAYDMRRAGTAEKKPEDAFLFFFSE